MSQTNELVFRVTTSVEETVECGTQTSAYEIAHNASPASDGVVVDEQTVTVATPVVYDFSSLGFASVHSIIVENTGDSGTIVVGGGSTPLMGTDVMTVRHGGCLGTHQTYTVSSLTKKVQVYWTSNSGETGASWKFMAIGDAT